MELDTYFDALESGFKEIEKDYNWAVETKASNVADLGKQFDEALLVYNAALDARFSVAEAVRQEELLPDIFLDED